ncbi:MAG: UvrB/UvrC motif-containing protein [Clostridia bacterium]|nr:UvrB/UvrC motif-containing protein [Clostridia bacterium]
MICQNCNKNEANMHMKRIVNGRAAEVHLCKDCARSLGYGEAFTGFGFGGLLGELLSKGEQIGSSVRCSFCGKSFEEIAGDGKMGCAECYNIFYDKLLPSLNRIHGKASYSGSRPQKEASVELRIEELKVALKAAVEQQNFELAATLRDRINDILAEGGEQ